MTVTRIVSLVLLLASSTLFAQRLSHPLSASRADARRTPRPAAFSADTVRVLAVMVQFQVDSSPRTTGNGQFVLSAPTDSILDAPPHDAAYFRSHLAFLENYYRKASNGKQAVRATLLDSVFTLGSTMATYSPPKGGMNDAVAMLARDAWVAVDASGLVPDFSAYDCFIVLHAGVGRDIDLLSVLGYDPGPDDIPSLYLGLNAFREAFGAGYAGIPVSGGSFHITNSVVAPETESRSIPGVVGGTILLEYTINGLLCSSLGNYLGLPDLFNTASGRSGIGRFGLMDGQAIFSFGGTAPPAPSAWERYWLGWITPVTVGGGTSALSLPAIGLSDSVYRVPISAEEYFMIENRNRDPLRDGQRVTSVFNGVSRQQVFPRDTTGYESADVSALAGVVTDVEDLDWSVPGGVDQNGTFYDGGVLIWHIDESVIRAGLESNTVNANPDLRGVDLEEADGSQDIGQQYGFLTAASGSEEGTALDFWFKGNASPVNTNAFSPTTFPDSRSNSGANSHITVDNFSERGPHMTATAIVGDADVAAMPGFPRSLGDGSPLPSLTVDRLSLSSVPSLLVSTSGLRQPARIMLLPVKPTGSPSPFAASGVFAQAPTGAAYIGSPAVVDTNGDGAGDLVVVSVSDSATLATNDLRGYVVGDADADSLADPRFSVRMSRRITTPPVVGDSMLAVGCEGGLVVFVGRDGVLIDSVRFWQDASVRVAGISLVVGPNAFLVTGSDGTVVLTYRSRGGGAARPDRSTKYAGSISGPAVSGLFRGGRGGIAFVAGSSLYLVDTAMQTFAGFPVPGELGPALADLDGDGTRDIITFSGDQILVYNSAGVSLDNYPLTLKTSRPDGTDPLASPPIVADVDGDGSVDIVGVTIHGEVVAVTRRGEPVRGFPLQSGSGGATAAVTTLGDSVFLAVSSREYGSLSLWNTGRAQGGVDPLRYPWSQYQRTARHDGYDGKALSGTPIASDFFPASRAYNWPNPVYGGTTHIRYFVRDDATVSVRIFDLAGDLVASFPGPGIGGADNEVNWDVSGIQSGIYLARIEASGGGSSGVAIIKVAVVK